MRSSQGALSCDLGSRGPWRHVAVARRAAEGPPYGRATTRHQGPPEPRVGPIESAVAPLFDRYIAVDWSANNEPKSGKDSIWSCSARDTSSELQTRNHRTRHSAEVWLVEQLTTAVHAGDRILVGLDFPYGYPAGFAGALGADGEPWRGVWNYLARHVVDDEDNVSNRFEVASDVNRKLGRDAPFWGRPQNLALPHLPTTKEVTYRSPHQCSGLPEWRRVEEQLYRLGENPHAVWKLFYTGAVGSQTLLGIPVVLRLRDHPALRTVSRVWPFEVLVPSFPVGSAAVLHAEIWPSIVPFAHEFGRCNDEKQVRAVVQRWRELDRGDRLAPWFEAPSEDELARQEEGWILGVPSSRTIEALGLPERSRGSRPTRRRAPAARAPLSPGPSIGRAPCLCGCGDYPRGKRSRFMPGHDQRINPATGRRFNDH
jgi:precorrin-8X/cobalt-precorrin-8 methylmutase